MRTESEKRATEEVRRQIREFNEAERPKRRFTKDDNA